MQPEMHEIPFDQPRLFHLPSWGKLSDVERVAFLRKITREGGADPQIATLANRVLAEAGVDARQYEKQADVLLKWVQRNIRYINEPGERLQDPLYTLKVGYGDCDDMAILLGALYESIRLPWRFVISGNDAAGNRVRWVEGTPMVRGAKWAHIYVCVGWPPFQPQKWRFAEPTLKSAPLGWDVVGAKSSDLPELSGPSAVTSGGTSAASVLSGGTFDWKNIAVAIVVGTATSVLSQMVLGALRVRRATA